ncbi:MULTISPECIES: Atu4866 domain-containing protein [Actinomadura]|uniref:Atu4866 domain-containing protein n=1 Tax=Actinomadura TaxID=1988 RepID=UPI0012E3177F|nr:MULTISPECIES: Atu4866 domain-containing protein [Actinomadura]MBT2207979.1 Atu4866 domain-containing protein [Actinomadura sp. NEAU-AAG7]
MSRTISPGVALATALLAVSLTATACSSDEDDPKAAPPSAGTTSAAPQAAGSSSAVPSAAAAEGTAPGAAGVVGTWASDDGSLRLVLNSDGTFVEDYNGQKAAYSGKYTVSGSTLTLNDKTGVTANGTVKTGSISLSGSTLTKKG